MKRDLDCHCGGYLTFPTECVSCGQPPTGIHTVRAFRAIDFLFFAIGDQHLITVPLCRRCYLIRSFFGPFVGMLIVMAAMAIPFLLFVSALNPVMKEVWAWVFIVNTILSLLYYRNWNDYVMDRLLSGIAAGKLQKDRTFKLWLHREELIGQLTYQPTPKRYVETAAYATYQQREQQQLHSWWAKCLVGMAFIGFAGVCYFALTKLEAGNRNFPLPDWIMVIYGLVGKWPICLLPGIFGGAGVIWGVTQLIRERFAGVTRRSP